MRQKTRFYLSLGLVLAALLVAALYLFRPKTIADGAERITLRDPVLRVGQALYAAGLRLDAADRVTPDREAWLPLDGHIEVRRASYLLVWDDGQVKQAAGVAAQAADLLPAAGVQLNEGDRLLWNGLPVTPSLPLEAGAQYVLQIERAMPFGVVEDGQKRSLQTRGPSLARALWEAGVQIAPGDWLSSDPGSALPAEGAAVAIQRAQPLTISASGQSVRARSAAATVGQALVEAGVALQGLDYSQPAEDQPLPDDGAIRVVRVSEALVFSQTLLPFESSLQPDPTLELDQRRTIEAGQYGIQVSRERVLYEDGQEISRIRDSEWTASQPFTRTVGYGTQVVPRTTDTPDGSIEYWRAVTVYATGYSPCRLGRPNYCNYRTASGATLTRGIIAVSQAWYRLMVGQRVYVPGYGFAVIADTGYGIPGTPWIDLGYDDDNFQGGARTVTLYFLTPAPENVPWILP